MLSVKVILDIPHVFYIAGGHDIVSFRGELVGGSDGGGSVVYVDGGLEVTTRLKCQWQKGRGKNRVEWCWQAIQISGAVYKNIGWWARFSLKLADCHFSCVKKILYVVVDFFFKFMPGLFSPFQDLLVCREMEQGSRVKHKVECSIITPVLCVWSYRNHFSMLIWCSKNISYYCYYHYFIFLFTKTQFNKIMNRHFGNTLQYGCINMH